MLQRSAQNLRPAMSCRAHLGWACTCAWMSLRLGICCVRLKAIRLHEEGERVVRRQCGFASKLTLTPVGTSLGHESIKPHTGEHIAPLMLTIVMFTSSAEHFPCPRAVVSAS